jgi:hypothetical protein
LLFAVSRNDKSKFSRLEIGKRFDFSDRWRQSSSNRRL